MPKAISNTSPLLYLGRAGIIEWLPKLFEEIWVPQSVVDELLAGQRRGYDVLDPNFYDWLQIVNPQHTPIEWLALDLGAGELAAMTLALENPESVVILDDQLARRTAQAAGLAVWGTLKILLEAKEHGLTEYIQPFLNLLENTGMWISSDIRYRILVLAGEANS